MTTDDLIAEQLLLATFDLRPVDLDRAQVVDHVVQEQVQIRPVFIEVWQLFHTDSRQLDDVVSMMSVWLVIAYSLAVKRGLQPVREQGCHVLSRVHRCHATHHVLLLALQSDGMLSSDWLPRWQLTEVCDASSYFFLVMLRRLDLLARVRVLALALLWRELVKFRSHGHLILDRGVLALRPARNQEDLRRVLIDHVVRA